MTDKEIIIDGVDVSGCKYCLKMTKYRCTIQRDIYKWLCEENPNCYYKQLKRKEQECEELKEKIKKILKHQRIRYKKKREKAKEVNKYGKERTTNRRRNTEASGYLH